MSVINGVASFMDMFNGINLNDAIFVHCDLTLWWISDYHYIVLTQTVGSERSGRRTGKE